MCTTSRRFCNGDKKDRITIDDCVICSSVNPLFVRTVKQPVAPVTLVACSASTNHLEPWGQLRGVLEPARFIPRTLLSGAINSLLSKSHLFRRVVLSKRRLNAIHCSRPFAVCSANRHSQLKELPRNNRSTIPTDSTHATPEHRFTSGASRLSFLSHAARDLSH